MNDELNSRYLDATAQRAALEQEHESATPERGNGLQDLRSAGHGS